MENTRSSYSWYFLFRKFNEKLYNIIIKIIMLKGVKSEKKYNKKTD